MIGFFVFYNNFTPRMLSGWFISHGIPFNNWDKYVYKYYVPFTRPDHWGKFNLSYSETVKFTWGDIKGDTNTNKLPCTVEIISGPFPEFRMEIHEKPKDLVINKDYPSYWNF